MLKSIALALAFLASAHAADTLRVMSFNVRLPAKSDGPNHWDHRRDILVGAIRKHAPDVFGTQELFHLQGQYIAEKLPEYAWFGVSRRGNQEDEFMGVFYRKDRLELRDSGNFWLSETPETPGSISWEASLPRMVTWGVFRDRKTKREFRFYNTHFAHRPQDTKPRLESARLIAERLAQAPKDSALIVTGDFNTDAETEPYRVLTGILKDSWVEAPNKIGPVGTFHGFKGTPGKARIDWILFRGALRPLSVETIADNQDGRYPSDHFPVIAVFEWLKR